MQVAGFKPKRQCLPMIQVVVDVHPTKRKLSSWYWFDDGVVFAHGAVESVRNVVPTTENSLLPSRLLACLRMISSQAVDVTREGRPETPEE